MVRAREDKPCVTDMSVDKTRATCASCARARPVVAYMTTSEARDRIICTCTAGASVKIIHTCTSTMAAGTACVHFWGHG